MWMIEKHGCAYGPSTSFWYVSVSAVGYYANRVHAQIARWKQNVVERFPAFGAAGIQDARWISHESFSVLHAVRCQGTLLTHSAWCCQLRGVDRGVCSLACLRRCLRASSTASSLSEARDCSASAVTAALAMTAAAAGLDASREGLGMGAEVAGMSTAPESATGVEPASLKMLSDGLASSLQE